MDEDEQAEGRETTVGEEHLRERVALMRELGVMRWGDILLGPPPPPKEVSTPRVERDAPKAEKTRSPDMVHAKFWAKLTRSSGAKAPPCSAGCACGAGRRSDGID